MENKEFNFDTEELNDFILSSLRDNKGNIMSQANFYKWKNGGIKPLNKVIKVLDSLGVEIKEITLFYKKDYKKVE